MKKEKDLKAIGMFIFAGSATIGVLENDYKVDRILEIADGVVTANAAHFIHNYPQIPVVVPSEWEKNGYLESLKNEKYDLLYSNTVCSGLSMINQNAKADNPQNEHFYRVFDAINKIQPKTFIIENAPTLLTIGAPIVKDLVNKVDNYHFTIIRDYGKNHGVAMQRQRTFLVGWRNDVFKSETPIIEVHKYHATIEDVIGDLEKEKVGSKNVLNHTLLEDRSDIELEKYIPFIKEGESVRQYVIKHYDELEHELSEKMKKSLMHQKMKMETGGNYWDKSPSRPRKTGLFDSMSSTANFVHPTLDRQLTIREYARIMGYPDNFEWVDCDNRIITCIAQGVPAPYFKWISGEVKQALLGNRDLYPAAGVMYQHHISMQAQFHSKEEFLGLNKLTDIDKKSPHYLKLEI